ncbi:MAG TPA: site-specific integrase [bacterium]|nr:site-specific integrase [bacterium]
MVRIFQRNKSSVYWFDIIFNGKRYQESTGETNRNLALKKATEREKEIKATPDYREHLKKLIEAIDSLTVNERDSIRNECIEKIAEGTIFKMTLENAFDAYREKPKKRIISERTYRDYQNLWNKFIQWTKENYPAISYLNEIDVEVAEKYLNSEHEKGLAERTYNERIKKFRAMFSALSKTAGLKENVWKSVDKMTEGTISKKMLTKNQLKDLFSITDGEMKVLFMIGLFTGLRLGDSATLKWNEIDFENGFIIRLPNKTKNLKKKIEIPLLGILRDNLEEIRNNLPDKNKSEYVLPEMARLYINSTPYLSKIIQQTFEKAGIETKVEREGTTRKTAVYGFHSFRHSFVSLCASGNIPVNVVMELVGHNSKAVHQIYQHATNEQKVKAIEAVEQATREKTE